MRSVNKVILIGNVTRDPELRQTQSGQSVCTFGLATNREWMTSDGRKKNSAEYHELVGWSQLAGICEKYVRKGKLLYVEGYLKTRSWDTPEGIRKFKTEVVIQDMIMLEKRDDGSVSQISFGDNHGDDMDDDANSDDSGFDPLSPEDDDTDDATSDIARATDEMEEEDNKPTKQRRNDIIDADLGL